MQNKTEFLNCKCRFKDIFWDFEQWKKWVIEPLITLNKIDNKDEVVDWLNDTKTIYTQEQIYTRIYREFHFLVFKSTNFQDIIYNLTNILEHQLQQLYLNSLGLIDNALSEFKNKNKQIRKNINQNQSKQKNKVSVTPTDLTVKDDLAEMPINQADFGESFNESINFTDDQLLIIKKMLSFELPNLFEKIKIALMPLFSQIIDKKDEVDPLNQELIDINNDINNLYQKNERLETIINNIINNEAVDFEKLFEKINAIDVDKINENIESEKQERKQADIDLQNNIDNLDTKIFNELGNTTELINEVETRLNQKDISLKSEIDNNKKQFEIFKTNIGNWTDENGEDVFKFTSKKIYSTSETIDNNSEEIVNKKFLNNQIQNLENEIIQNTETVNNLAETVDKAFDINDSITLKLNTEYKNSEIANQEFVNNSIQDALQSGVDLTDYAKTNKDNIFSGNQEFNNLTTKNIIYIKDNNTNVGRIGFGNVSGRKSLVIMSDENSGGHILLKPKDEFNYIDCLDHNIVNLKYPIGYKSAANAQFVVDRTFNSYGYENLGTKQLTYVGTNNNIVKSYRIDSDGLGDYEINNLVIQNKDGEFVNVLKWENRNTYYVLHFISLVNDVNDNSNQNVTVWCPKRYNGGI